MKKTISSTKKKKEKAKEELKEIYLEAFRNAELIKQGKLKGRPVKELLDEL